MAAERFAVIGLGRFGMKLAQELAAGGAEVIAIDLDRSVVEEARDLVTLAIRLDATSEDDLRAQGIDAVDVAVVGIGQDFEANALATSTLKSMGVGRVIARAGSEVRGKILQRIGADEIVFPEDESALRWAHRLLFPRMLARFELAEGYSLVQVPAPKAFHNHTLIDLKLRQKYHVTLVAIKRQVKVTTDEGGTRVKEAVMVPAGETQILPEDILVVMGADERVDELAGA